MHEAGLEPKIAVGDSQVGSGYHAVGRLMKRKEPPTAIFGANDLTALGVLHGAGSAGFAAIL